MSSDFPVAIGSMRPRLNRVVKNGRWYSASDGGLAKIGWGDLAASDLDAIAEVVADGTVVVVLLENPGGGQHLPHQPGVSPAGWCWYDRPDCRRITPTELARAASFAVFDRSVHVVSDAEVGRTCVRVASLETDEGVPGVYVQQFPKVSAEVLAVHLRLIVDALGDGA